MQKAEAFRSIEVLEVYQRIVRENMAEVDSFYSIRRLVNQVFEQKLIGK